MVFSIAAHALIFAAIFAITRPGEEAPPPPPKPEEVTYVDVTEIPPPPEPEVVEPEPAPVEPEPQPQAPRPAAAPRQPRNPPPVQKANEVAGTQELKTPPVVTGIPDPSVAAPPVKAEDFGGRGAIGGTAAGTPPPTPPATSTGSGEGGGSSGGTSGTYSAAMVDKRAELINRETIARRLQQLYPPLLRDAGVAGKVTVQMVVGSDGRVDMSTVKIISTSHEAFADVTMQIMKDLRFSPAKMGSTSVRMLTVMPVSWKLDQ